MTSAEPVVLDVPAGPSLAARLGAEAFGTFGLVLVILGAGLYLPLSNAGTLGVALAAGLVLAGLIAALGHVSGGHFNPAVSLGAAFSGRLSVVDLLLYWLSQVFGGVLAAAILFVTIPSALPALLGATDSKTFFALTANGWGVHSPLSALSQGQVTFDLKSALIIEVVTTAVFVAVTIGVTSRRVATGVGPFAVGITLAAVLLVAGPVTGGGVNPARSTAAALFSGGAAIGQLWLFWLAPLLGAAIVGLFALAFAPVTEPFVDVVVVDEDDEDLDDEDEDARERTQAQAAARGIDEQVRQMAELQAAWERAHPGQPMPAVAAPMLARSGGTNTLAILALVFGIIGGGVVPVILGHLARAQIRRTGEAGDGMAVAGLVLGYVGIAILVGYLVFVVGLLNSLS